VQAGEREGVTEAGEPERSVVPQYLALGVSPLRDIWEGCGARGRGAGRRCSGSIETFRQALRGLGYIESQNIAIEDRYAGGTTNGCRSSRLN